MQLILTALLPLLASVADARHLPLRRYRQDQQQHHHHARHMDVALDERGLPITATTTVVVDMTSTQTIWVQPTPTGQVPFETTSVSVSTSTAIDQEASSASASSAETVSGTVSESASSGPTEAASSYSSESWSSAASGSDWASSVAGSGPATSQWASETLSSDMASATASPSQSVSENNAEPSSSASASEIASASASMTESTSASASSPGSSIDPASTSDASSSSSSYSETLTEASTPSSSIASTSVSSIPVSSFASTALPSVSASASTSVNATSSTSASSMFASASVTDSSTSAAPSSTSSMWNGTSSSASSSALTDSSTILPPSTSASSSSAVPSTTRLPNVPRHIMAGYYPDWSAWTLPPESVDWSKFDVVDFAFALPTADGRLEFTQSDSSDLLQRLVAGAHKHGKRVKLSIGGWTGSKYFSTLVADPAKRANFVNNCLQAYVSYGLDGIDIDWEYPNAQGAGGNAVSSADSANFLLYLQDLRKALPSEAIITLATQVWPFAGANGRPLGDVSGFAAVIDWILIMNYDIWGSSDNPGPNAPLSDACGTSTQPLANAYASVASWTAAGMPANQITLGIPAYGYLQKSWASSLRTRDYIPPSADEVANYTAVAALHKRQSGLVTVRNGGGGDDNGQIGFADLIKQGALAIDSQGKYIGAGGFYREWDVCSSTPWLRSSYTGQVVTYDDPDSLSMKAQFARQSGLRGCNMFSMDGDWTGSSWPLADAVRSGMGI